MNKHDTPLEQVQGRPQGDDDTLTLRDLFVYIWRRKLMLLILNVAGVILTIISLMASRPVYTASMVVGPPAGSTSASTLSSLAGLAGVRSDSSSTGPGGLQPSDFLSLFRSQALVSAIDDKTGLRRRIFAAAWDAKHKRWDMSPKGAKAWIKASVRTLVGKPIADQPTYTDTATWLTQNITITYDQPDNQWTISTNSTNPKFALWLLQTLYNQTQDYLKTRLRTQSLSEKAYLNRRLSEVTVEDYRQALLAMLSDQEKSLMLLDSNAPIAARIIVPATVTDSPTAPSITLTLVLGALISIVFSLLICVAMDSWQHLSAAVAQHPPHSADLRLQSWLGRLISRVRDAIYRVARLSASGAATPPE